MKTKTRKKLKCQSLKTLLTEGKRFDTVGRDCRKSTLSDKLLSKMTSSNLYCDHSELDSDSD